MSSKSVVFFTAYNEEKNLGTFLGDVPESVDAYLVDDGSTDRTVEVAQDFGLKVIQHPINMGQGTAFLTALNFVVETDYEYLVHLDADGQHDPTEIPKFIRKLEETNYDIVAGSRILGSNYEEAPIFRRLGLRPLNFILNILTGYQLTDYMCGFRAFRVEAIRKVKPLFNEMNETEYLASEMWIKFARKGLTATDVPINLRERTSGTSYKGHALARYGFGVITTILRSLLETYREDPNE